MSPFIKQFSIVFCCWALAGGGIAYLALTLGSPSEEPPTYCKRAPGLGSTYCLPSDTSEPHIGLPSWEAMMEREFAR